MSQTYLNLQQSEGLVFQSACAIYAAYISAGRVPEGEETHWMKRSIGEAIKIARATDSSIVSDDESTVGGLSAGLSG